MLQRLPAETVAALAAGQVVERPASVVKELIENAIDAGATVIQIAVRGSALDLIQVTDNGCGIPSTSVHLAFQHHTTSKISCSDEAHHTHTLGFRGEALALIAAVAQVTCCTRANDEADGVELRIAGGEVQHLAHVERAVGTTITVQHLFYNHPERLAFIRSDTTEMLHITSIVQRYAMAYPRIAWTLVTQGRPRIQTAGSGDLLDVVEVLYDPDLAGQLLSIDCTDQREDRNWRVRGLISPPSLTRSSWADCLLVVNGRLIQPSGLIFAEIEAAYGSLLGAKQFPLCILLLDINPAVVDVTLHATKTQARFSEPSAVLALLGRAIREALADHRAIVTHGPVTTSTSTLQQRVEQSHIDPRARHEPTELAFLGPVHAGRNDTAQPIPAGDQVLNHAMSLADTGAAYLARRLPPLRLVGDVQGRYLIAEAPDALYIIRREAAHCRVIYDACCRAEQHLVIPGELCATPLALAFAPAIAAGLLAHQEELLTWGFVVEPGQPGMIVVRNKPIGLAPERIAAALADLGVLLQVDEPGPDMETNQGLMLCIAKHLAVPDGQPLEHTTQRMLIQYLERCSNPYVCPAGQVIIQIIPQPALDQQFSRDTTQG